MNNLYIALISILSFLPSNTEDDCVVVYTRASYALSHSKKALKANNFEHQMYYAGKTLESYKKITEAMESCSCENLTEIIQDIMNDVEKAADPADWDRGRYYSKKVYTSTQELITVLDKWAESNSQPESPSTLEQ